MIREIKMLVTTKDAPDAAVSELHRLAAIIRRWPNTSVVLTYRPPSAVRVPSHSKEAH